MSNASQINGFWAFFSVGKTFEGFFYCFCFNMLWFFLKTDYSFFYFIVTLDLRSAVMPVTNQLGSAALLYQLSVMTEEIIIRAKGKNRLRICRHFIRT